MFATYDYSNFPEVKVMFHGSPKDDSDFQLFLDQWLKLYEDGKDFTFLFDVEHMVIGNPYYCYKVASFIGEMKTREYQYLKSSKIINMNTLAYGLLKLVFMIQSPISEVTIHHTGGTISFVPP